MNSFSSFIYSNFRIRIGHFYFENSVVEQKKSEKIVFHDIFVSEENEIFDSVPVSYKAIVRSQLRLQQSEKVLRRIRKMKIKFINIFLFFVMQLVVFYLSDLGQTYADFHNYLVE